MTLSVSMIIFNVFKSYIQKYSVNKIVLKNICIIVWITTNLEQNKNQKRAEGWPAISLLETIR